MSEVMCKHCFVYSRRNVVTARGYDRLAANGRYGVVNNDLPGVDCPERVGGGPHEWDSAGIAGKSPFMSFMTFHCFHAPQVELYQTLYKRLEKPSQPIPLSTSTSVKKKKEKKITTRWLDMIENKIVGKAYLRQN